MCICAGCGIALVIHCSIVSHSLEFIWLIFPVVECIVLHLFLHSILQYLRDALTPFIHTLMDEYSEEECEVDPMKLPSSASLPQNQATLTVLVARAWAEILKSYNKFPSSVPTHHTSHTHTPAHSVVVPIVPLEFEV